MAVPLIGHTPGHSGYMIASGSDSLLIWGDIIHVPEIQVPRPEVTIEFDTDPAAAAATRTACVRHGGDRPAAGGGYAHPLPGVRARGSPRQFLCVAAGALGSVVLGPLFRPAGDHDPRGRARLRARAGNPQGCAPLLRMCGSNGPFAPLTGTSEHMMSPDPARIGNDALSPDRRKLLSWTAMLAGASGVGMAAAPRSGGRNPAEGGCADHQSWFWRASPGHDRVHAGT